MEFMKQDVLFHIVYRYVNSRRQTLFEVTQIKLNGQLCYDVSHTPEIAAIQM